MGAESVRMANELTGKKEKHLLRPGEHVLSIWVNPVLGRRSEEKGHLEAEKKNVFWFLTSWLRGISNSRQGQPSVIKKKILSLTNTAEGSCGKFEKVMNMECERLEAQLFPLLTVWE